MGKRKTVLLYSGGMDSYLIDKIINPDVKLYINTHSRYAEAELDNLPEDVVVVDLDLSTWEREDSIIPLRNLYFAMVASNYGDIIVLGATAGDRVLDKSYTFAEKSSDLLSYLYQEQHWTPERKIDILLPFKDFTKTDLVRKYKELGGDLDKAWHESFSCYHPKKPLGSFMQAEECWECKPCYRKFIAFWKNGYRPAQYIVDRWTKFAKENLKQLLAELDGRGVEKNEFIETYASIVIDEEKGR